MWTSTVLYSVFTRIKAEVLKSFSGKYTDITVTTSSINATETKFPTVYVKKMQGAELGQTLDGTTINAIQSTIQVDVTDNVSEARAQEVADKVCEVMKGMRYQVVGEPFPDSSLGVYRVVARYSRVIGYNDIL